jgi:hypothetical protein
MPKRKTHIIVGGGSGAITAALAAREQQPLDLIAETLGGVLGGIVGSLAPDVIEPAVHPQHRSFAHSYVAAGSGTATAIGMIPSFQKYCRYEATWHDRQCLETDEFWPGLWHFLVALFWRLLSGFVVGLTAGYMSHLVLDAGSSRGLPLLK